MNVGYLERARRSEPYRSGPALLAPDIHAVSVPFRASELGEPVTFGCGAMPRDLSGARMRTEVGPALRDAVRELERVLGRPSVAVGCEP